MICCSLEQPNFVLHSLSQSLAASGLTLSLSIPGQIPQVYLAPPHCRLGHWPAVASDEKLIEAY